MHQNIKQEIERDLELYGVAYTVDGQRVAPERVVRFTPKKAKKPASRKCSPEEFTAVLDQGGTAAAHPSTYQDLVTADPSLKKILVDDERVNPGEVCAVEMYSPAPDKPVCNLAHYKPMESPTRYPLELTPELQICLWNEAGHHKWTIAYFHEGKDGFDLHFVGDRPLDPRVNWNHLLELVKQGFQLARKLNKKED